MRKVNGPMNEYEVEMGIGMEHKVALAMGIAMDALAQLQAFVVNASHEEVKCQLQSDRDEFVRVDIHDIMLWMMDQYVEKGWNKLAPESVEYIIGMAHRMHHSNVEALAIEYGVLKSHDIVVKCDNNAKVISVDAGIPSVALMAILSDAINFIHK